MTRLDRFFKRAPARSIADPVLGVLEADRSDTWRGTVHFGGAGREIQLIVGTAGEPSDAQRQAFRELERRYGALRSELGAALFELWKPCLDEYPADHIPSLPRSAQEMLSSTNLETIWIDRDAHLMLSFGFAVDGIWDDACLNITLDDWVPRPAGIDV
jgi:hypothetical protein